MKLYPWWTNYPKTHAFVKTGEFRKPLSGEYYLSGAIPEVYQSWEHLPK